MMETFDAVAARRIPLAALPETTLREPEAVPPIRTPLAASTSTPSWLLPSPREPSALVPM